MNTNRLLFYDNIRNDEIVQIASKILCEAESAAEGGEVSREAEAAYYELQRRLLAAVPYGEAKGSFWENYICRLTAESENRFSLMSERGETDELILSLAAGDAAELCRLMEIDWSAAESLFSPDRPCVCSLCPPLREDSRARQLLDILKAGEPAEKTAEALRDYYAGNYCGLLGKYRAFLWNGSLCGVKHQDPITFDDLIGYDQQQRQLIRNTETFVKGGRANNVLLYGDKGTGKSSSVKALLNRFGDEGLRMINVPKSRIFDIGTIMETVAGRGCRFIIFIDDLSFEATEIEYKHFKSVPEGGVAVQPENVLLYVTSNRRNLVKETWKDRNGDEGEVHVNDGIHERQSLADRFGLKITFTAPDRELYSEIVKSIAEKEGLQVDPELLLAEANKWDMRQTSRSGRSARQFVTHMAGMQHQEE